jgi:hypothetical protein
MILKFRPSFILSAAVLLILFTSAAEAKSRIFTLWPLVDYRSSEVVDYSSLNLLGPLVKFERKGQEREFGLRPLYFHAADEEGVALQEFLYPIASRKRSQDRSAFQGLHLLQYDSGDREREGKGEEFMLFPFVFSGLSQQRGPYFAFFPLGGKLYERFGREEIHFTLFPLYARTEHRGTINTHVLWPVFRRTEGPGEEGFKIWPLYGSSDKEGVYRKRFYLWPFFFSQDLNLDSDQPRSFRGFFPFYLRDEAPQVSSRTWLWPFFSHVENRERGYEEINFPWPLLRRTDGEYKEGFRALPFYSNERTGDFRKRWIGWPVYKIEELNTEILDRKRTRVLFFIYSDLEEHLLEESRPRLRRVALWPLFTYERTQGISHFYTLSLLEPFFPGNRGIERNWSPLWRIYQRKWDGQGNEISTLLWNLYWKERRGDDLAVELFPLFSYRRESEQKTELALLKGLLRLQRDTERGRLHLLYLPWGIPWGGGIEAETN